jgi:hypothetical protein
LVKRKFWYKPTYSKPKTSNRPPLRAIIFDHFPVNWDEEAFSKHDWSTFYADAKEKLPPNMPEARGNPVQVNCFTDADHAGRRITRKSHTGIIIFVNRAPVIWYSKAQNTIEF